MRNSKKIILILLPLILVASFFLPQVRAEWFNILQLFAQLDPQKIAEYIRSFGIYSVVISFALMVLQSVAAPLPSFLITFANSAVYGWMWGALLSWTSAMAGAAFCFFLARFYGRDLVTRLTGKTALNAVDQFFNRFGTYAILIARLLPFVPFDLISYGAGLTGMRWVPFLVATGIGQLPATLIYSYVGELLVGGAKTFVYGLLIIFAFLVVVVAIRNYLQHRKIGEK